MKPEDVMKALECCVKVGGYRDEHYCNDCPLHGERCALLLPQNALALLRENRSQISILKKLIDRCETKFSEKDAKIERLQGALKAEEQHNEFEMECAKKALANARADTVRKMQERLKGAFNFGHTILEKSICDIIDKIAKEMLEES